jgi:hypothetical protein
MRIGKWILMTLVVCGWAAKAPAQDSGRYYEENGITYYETKRKVSRPISQTQLQDQQQTVLREKVDTQLQDVPHTITVPVTEYRTQAHWVGRWNPFVQPYLTYKTVPTTRWETRLETLKVPVSRRQVVPELTTVKVPVTSMRMVDEEITSRIAVARRGTTDPFANGSNSAIATNQPYGTNAATAASGRYPPAAGAVGGISQLDQDPPRAGNSTSAWRSADPLRR